MRHTHAENSYELEVKENEEDFLTEFSEKKTQLLKERTCFYLYIETMSQKILDQHLHQFN